MLFTAMRAVCYSAFNTQRVSGKLGGSIKGLLEGAAKSQARCFVRYPVPKTPNSTFSLGLQYRIRMRGFSTDGLDAFNQIFMSLFAIEEKAAFALGKARYLDISENQEKNFANSEEGGVAFFPLVPSPSIFDSKKETVSLAKLPLNGLIQEMLKFVYLFSDPKDKMGDAILVLSSAYACLSTNPSTTMKLTPPRFMAALAGLHTAHWKINDMIDDCKDHVMDGEHPRFASTLIDLCLNCMKEEKAYKKLYEAKSDSLRVLIKDNEEARLKILDDIPRALDLLVRGTQGIKMSLSALSIDSNNFTRFDETFRNALVACGDKISVRSNATWEDYKLNRSESAGTIPYMNLNYKTHCIEREVSPKVFDDFLQLYQEKILEIEKTANLLNGIMNDEHSFLRDRKSDTFNAVLYHARNYVPITPEGLFIELKNIGSTVTLRQLEIDVFKNKLTETFSVKSLYKDLNKLDASLTNESVHVVFSKVVDPFIMADHIYSAITINTISLRKQLYADYQKKLSILEQELRMPDHLCCLQVIADGVRDQVRASSIYYYFHERHRPENKALAELNSTNYTEPEKKDNFNRRIEPNL
jgi:hypothetical protein